MSTPARIGSRAEAEGFVARICFKHGPPRLHGVELEWTVHHADDPRRPLDVDRLRSALGAHAPVTLVPGSEPVPLARGSLVTVEPGGQVEISAPASESVGRLLDDVAADAAELTGLLAAAGLEAGTAGADPHRLPRRILDVPRYSAMQALFDAVGREGSRMMCSTASLQVCLDAGEPGEVATRWRAVHALGPPLVALFANSAWLAGRDTGWASARLRATLGTCPPYTSPPGPATADGHPASYWARLAMDAPVICIRRPGDRWDAPAGLTFGAWADGALGERPTADDLEYHLSTLFPPVRPRGYLEVRYLDAQAGDDWVAPTVLLCALMSDPALVDEVLEITEPVADRWLQAARHGLDDVALHRAASRVVELGCGAIDRLDIDPVTTALVTRQLHRRVDDNPRKRRSA